jgi:hypothetical protein
MSEFDRLLERSRKIDARVEVIVGRSERKGPLQPLA